MDAYVFHNIFSAAVMSYSPIWAYAIAVLTSLAVATILTYTWGLSGLDEEKAQDLQVMETESKSLKPSDVKMISVVSPLDGDVIELKEVDDEVFASGVTGKGVAIVPTNNVVVSPVEGTVSVLFPSKHAVGITTKDGVELLVHIGLNTVMLNGEGFTAFVKQGDKVVCGQKLLEFDKKFILSKGYSLQSPVLVTNADQFSDIVMNENQTVKTGEELYKVLA